jgi:integrase
MEGKRGEKTRASTLKSYNLPIQVLNDLFGPTRPIPSFEYSDGERVIEFLKRVPVHADKHYPGKSLVEAATAESSKPRHGVLSAKRQSDVFTVIRSIFACAEERDWLAKNPFRAKALARQLPAVSDSKRVQMTGDELTRILSSPDFLKEKARTGHSGEPHQGRFWAVLLLLFHGLRANEAAQLLVSDIKEEGGITFIDVSETDDSGNVVKQTKTKTSIRQVPLHKEILKIGFLEFVQSRREHDPGGRLFHEFKANNIGNYAASLSKWFSRLRDKVFGRQKKMGDKSLHSLRHGVTDAVRRVTTSDEIRYALCGHSDGKEKNSGAGYGDGYPMRTLKEIVDKIEFDGLDLSFLYPAQNGSTATP